MKTLAPKPLLRVEGLAVLIGICVLYRALHGSWLVFAAFFFAPDLFMLGYLFGNSVGASAYNLVHTYTAPLAVGFVAYSLSAPFLVLISLVWTAHIGFDRFLGYGLKYATGFKDTHLGKV
jgi:Domain of unknown function (DUF4260)